MAFSYTKPVMISRANKLFKLPVLEVPHLLLTGFHDTLQPSFSICDAIFFQTSFFFMTGDVKSC